MNGDIDNFVDKLRGGEEVIYTYHGKKYFSQGYTQENGDYHLFGGKTFWECEKEMEWGDE